MPPRCKQAPYNRTSVSPGRSAPRIQSCVIARSWDASSTVSSALRTPAACEQASGICRHAHCTCTITLCHWCSRLRQRF